jgi:hypothetical protein
LVQSIQQAQSQGRMPVRPVALPANQPYGYGSPQQQQMYGTQPMGYPYGPQWMSPAGMEQSGYYGGEDDFELAQAYAAEESFPDEGIQGENSLVYEG